MQSINVDGIGGRFTIAMPIEKTAIALAVQAGQTGRNRALSALLATTVLTSALGLSMPVSAQIIPPNQSGTVADVQAGADHTNDQTHDNDLGASGGNADVVSLEVQNPSQFVSSGTNGAVIQALSKGGGGARGGYGDATNGGNGGVGGAGGNVDFTMDMPLTTFTGVAATGANSTALDVESTGGNGGDGAGFAEQFGDGGAGGTGGNAGNLTVNILHNPANPAQENFFQAGYTNHYNPGSTAIKLISAAGNAGDHSEADHEDGATGGAGSSGGSSGSIIANINATIGSEGFGILAESTGGNGGAGGDANVTTGTAKAGDGGVGGQGGGIYLNLAGGSVQGRGADSAGTGGSTDDGSGHNTSVNLSSFTSAVFAQSKGGDGGTGGGSNGNFGAADSGAGGQAGNGGVVTVDLSGMSASTFNYNAPGVVALSLGGAGGNSSSTGGIIFKKGGKGGTGGDGGLANIVAAHDSAGYISVNTTGGNSDGLVAQSIGGGGGYGGTVTGGGAFLSAALGGNGGSGGKGDQVDVTNGMWTLPDDPSNTPYINPTNPNGVHFRSPYVVATTGDYSFGVNAQSVGGGGGRGGDATGANLGPLALTIGGIGGSGGDAQTVTVDNFGIIQTSGNQSVGVFAQSVGGGGGAGGGAISTDIGSGFTASIAVGGKGGTGGDAGGVLVNNFKQIVTQGSNADAVLAQSVGGGGGNGGTSLSQTFAINPPDMPSATLNASVGGNGGTGGIGGEVDVLNTALIGTQGVNSNGVFAQSIGGGGGNGGDASATNQSNRQSSLTVTTAIGGKGRSGGVGGEVNVFNSGLINTLGEGSVGVFAQSVGGGGGTGGFGASNTGAYDGPASATSLQLTVSMGGNGGTGGDGAKVTVDNFVDSSNYSNDGTYGSQPIGGAGQIVTTGDNAEGIFAQSVGGGGGVGGDSVAQGSNGKINVNIGIGGNGGAGGQGGDVTVNNGAGAILTTGGSSSAVFAQSVGGGGGKGGKAATGSGSDPQYSYPEFIADQLAASLGQDPNSSVQKVSDTIWDWKDNIQSASGSLDSLKNIVSQYSSKNPASFVDASKSALTNFSVDIGAGWGGNGGAAGDGGTVTLSNPNGNIFTTGTLSHGLFGESIGGGGGVGGAAAPSMSNDQIASSTINGSIGVGGTGGSSGAGGTVSVTNDGNIETDGDLSNAMFAQSVGGGGGVGGITAPKSGLGTSFTIAAGGHEGAWGAGGLASVENSDTLVTKGYGSVGMLAQSIGGGGGVAALMAANYDPTTGKSGSTAGSVIPQGAPNLLAVIPGDAGNGSNGGTAQATLHSFGTINTSGVNGYGILAQSVGGGGGLLFPGATDVNPDTLFTHSQSNDAFNAGGLVNVTSDTQTSIQTSGNGAAGIVAQSVGGGGGIINGLDGVELGAATAHSLGSRINTGTGGNVTVTNASDITTTGNFATGIFAQSVGGSGGVIGRYVEGLAGYLFGGVSSPLPNRDCSKAPGGCTGDVVVNLTAGTIETSGEKSFGVYGMSQGNDAGHNTVTVNVGANANITVAGQSSGAILLNGFDSNTVNNYGVIDGSGGFGLAVGSGIASTGLALPFIVNNYQGAVLKGSLGPDGTEKFPAVSSALNNAQGALLEAGSYVNVASVNNNGTFTVGAPGRVATTSLGGDFIQGPTGVLVADADIKAGAADKMTVTGKAVIGGEVKLLPDILVKAPALTVLTAAGGVTMEPKLDSSPAATPFSTDARVVGNDLQVQTKADFNGAASQLGDNQRKVAAHLQEIWDAGSRMDNGFTSISKADANEYATGLASLSGQSLGAIAAARYRSDQVFVGNMLNGCEATDDQGRCGWVKVINSSTDRDTTSDVLGYHFSGTTVQIGGQALIAPDLTLGGSLAYEDSSLNGDLGTSSVDGRSVTAGVGLSYTIDRWEIASAMDVGMGSYDSTRNIAVGDDMARARSTPKAWNAGTHLRVSYDQPLSENWHVKPYAGVHASYAHTDAYTEKGAGDFDLSVDKESHVPISSDTGVQLSGQFKAGKSLVVKPYVSAGVEYLGNSDWAAKARFVDHENTQGFTASTPLPNLLHQVGLGADVTSGSNWDVRLQYAAGMGKDYLSQTGSVRLSIDF